MTSPRDRARKMSTDALVQAIVHDVMSPDIEPLAQAARDELNRRVGAPTDTSGLKDAHHRQLCDIAEALGLLVPETVPHLAEHAAKIRDELKSLRAVFEAAKKSPCRSNDLANRVEAHDALLRRRREGP